MAAAPTVPAVGERDVSASDRRALLVGFGALVVILPAYLALADRAGRPLAVFAVAPLLAAVIGSWKATVLTGAASLAVAVVVGVSGPLAPVALFARWGILVIATAAAAIGAWFRERQAAELIRLSESSALYQVFEASLRPTPTPPAGFDVAVRYLASEEAMTLGGDFVDAFGLDDGRLALVIGDVSGHGAHQAAFATALRAAWRSIAGTHRPDPAAWIDQLGRTAFQPGHDDLYVTMCTAVIDRARGTALVASAGHPPPVLVGDTPTPAPVEPGVPLGIGMPGPWCNVVVAIPDRLVFYTDGLIENPRAEGDPERWSEAGLVTWLAVNPAADADRLADRLLADALAGRERRDDIALMVVDVVPE